MNYFADTRYNPARDGWHNAEEYLIWKEWKRRSTKLRRQQLDWKIYVVLRAWWFNHL